MMRDVLRTMVSLLVTVAGARAETGEQAGVFSRQPYLQMATPTTVTVVWRTRVAMKGELRVREKGGDGVVSVPVETMTVRRLVEDGESSAGARALHSAPPGTWQYEATVSGLKPDTTYGYEIVDGGKVVTPADGSCVLRTHPEVGVERPFSFWVVGDSGTGSESQKGVYESFKAWRANAKRDVDFYVHVGDMAYKNGRDAEFQFGFFGVYEDVLRGLTCWPTMGNHEGHTSSGRSGVGPYYDAYVTPTRGEAGGLASGTEAYYSWDYGRTHFVSLDTYDLAVTAEGAMSQWLKADLERTKADWVIAYWHHPPYTKGSHDSDGELDLTEVREHLMPIIESGGVDLVLTGHSHVYERSFLLNGAYATPTVAANVVLDDGTGDPFNGGPYHKMPGLVANSGTVQIVAGHGGQALMRRHYPSPVMRKTIAEWGSVLVEVDGRTLTATMLDVFGKVRDTVQIVKDAKVVGVGIAEPRAPGEPEGPYELKSRVVVPGAAGLGGP
jgi:hypothetical protein